MLLYVDVQFASPYALSAFVALQEKGLPFTIETLDLAAGDQQRPDFARLSITARVPTLVDGDFALSESSAIAEYLDEAHPGPALYPAAPRARARARQVQAWLRSDFLPLRQERSTEVIFYGPTPQPLSAAAAHSAARLFAAAGELLAHGDDHLCGDAWCIADVDLALMLNRLLLNGDAVPDALARYATR
ncbi:glutathione transferase, partial [Accumulibacter sp.]|uniref:glutathione transferase n=1 Tax=Accumulibacter sp. TaxID=2053492 RepID=UPI00257B39D8